jgi:hypothetical protein
VKAQGFAYRTTKQGDVFIEHQGRHVVTLRGSAAERFLKRVSGAGDDEAQMVMAKATGNFKRGNERRQSTKG